MAKHRRFNVDRFLEKFEGREPLLRRYGRLWDGRLKLDAAKLDVPRFREFLIGEDRDGMDDLVEDLYRVYDLSTDRGREDLLAVCGTLAGYEPDPKGDLPPECLSLKVRTDNEDAFDLAYARHDFENAERFSVFRGRETRAIADVAAAIARFEQRLAEVFKDDKKSERVLVRPYREGSYTNFVVYHEKRSRAELVFAGTKARPRLRTEVFRPAQQDFLSYDHASGQLEIETRYEREGAMLRTAFAACCLGDEGFFEGAGAADRIDLTTIRSADFGMPTDDGDAAALVELHFTLPQAPKAKIVVRSTDVLETLDRNGIRGLVAVAAIDKAVLKLTFPGDRRGKRVELVGRNTIGFRRATRAAEVMAYLRRWGLLRA